MKSILLATLVAVGAGASFDADAQRYYGARYESCGNCGEVIDINRYADQGRRSSGTSGVGAVTGAIIGGLLGNQVGGGSGKKVATVAGAVAGGVAGNRIEKNRKGGSDDFYEVIVRMDNGRRATLQQDDLDGVRIGDRVEIRGGKAYDI